MGRAGEVGLVVFDCDGVLVDSERIAVEIESRLLTDLGWSITVEEIAERFLGRSDGLFTREIIGRLGDEGFETFRSRAIVEVGEAMDARLVAIGGAEVAVRAVKARGVSACVASGSFRHRLAVKLGRTGLLDLFDGHVFSVDDVDRGKPWPDLFLLAATTLGVEPERCVVVEDSVPGVEAAHAAGMRVYGYSGGLTSAERLAAAGATTFADMHDLDQVIFGPG